jgi:hypothetical protein
LRRVCGSLADKVLALTAAAERSRIAEVAAIPAAEAQRSPDGFAKFLHSKLANARRAAELARLASMKLVVINY